MPVLTPDQEKQIREYIHNQQLLYAIKLYREVTGVGLAEAKAAVEAMERGEVVQPPLDRIDYDNPVMEAKIESLLSKKQKLEAIKIYREEYGVGLKEAKDAVERIEASMRSRGVPSINVPYESAIGSDPFENAGENGRRIAIIVVGVVALMACGVALFLLAVGGS